MKTIIAMALCGLALGTGCVNVTSEGNYRPQNAETAQAFYACEQQSNQPTAGARWNTCGGAIAVGTRLPSSKYIGDP